jgi:anti-sigma factor RsiW
MRFPGSWEGILEAVPADMPSFAGKPPSAFCGAWGPRIETTLLADLSEEERRGLAEHVQSCSACAERFRRYQFIEEFAGELPRYDLLGRGTTHSSSPSTVKFSLRRWAPLSLVRRSRRSRRGKRAFVVMLVLCLALFLAAVRESVALLATLLGLLVLALLVPVVWSNS